jgi:hypothetical protein
LKKFKTQGVEDVRLASIDGHVTFVTPEWKELHPRFHSQAYSMGCISDDMVRNTALEGMDTSVVNTLNNVALQKNEVETAIKRLVADNNLDAFDSKGKPKSTILTEMVGFRVTNPVRDEVWYKVQEQSNDAT